tara:strand:- start:620 stop:868 length:249 start_codon:yes stop_codon:yes gene_type:complete
MFNIGDKFIQVPTVVIYKLDYEVYHVIDILEHRSRIWELVLLKEGQTNCKYVGETHIKDCVDRGLLEYVKKGDHFIRRHKLV